MKQNVTNFKPTMKLSFLLVFIVLTIVEGAPKIDNEYHEFNNQLFDYEDFANEEQPETASNLNSEDNEDEHLSKTESGHYQQESNNESDQEDKVNYEADKKQSNDEDKFFTSEDSEVHEKHQPASNHEDAQEEKLNDEVDNKGPSDEDKLLTSGNSEPKEKQKSHWFSFSKKQNVDSDALNDAENEETESAKRKMAAKVNSILRRQVLKKASQYAGDDFKDSDEHQMIRKVSSLARDFAIRKGAPKLLSKTLHGGVNFVKSKLDDLDAKDRALGTRDVDLYNQRMVARDLGFRFMDKMADTLSTVIGGTVAEGTIRHLHKDKNNNLEDVVEDLGEENLVHMAESMKKGEKEHKHLSHKTNKKSHHHHQSHAKAKHENAKHKKGKHHKKEKPESEDELKEEHQEQSQVREVREDNERNEDKEDIETEEHNKHSLWHGKKHKHEKKDKKKDTHEEKDKHHKKEKHEKKSKHEHKDKHEKEDKHDKKHKHETKESKHHKHKKDEEGQKESEEYVQEFVE